MNPGIQNSSYDTIFETFFYALLGIEKKHGYAATDPCSVVYFITGESGGLYAGREGY